MTQAFLFNINNVEKEMGNMSEDNDIRAITHTQPYFQNESLKLCVPFNIKGFNVMTSLSISFNYITILFNIVLKSMSCTPFNGHEFLS